MFNYHDTNECTDISALVYVDAIKKCSEHLLGAEKNVPKTKVFGAFKWAKQLFRK